MTTRAPLIGYTARGIEDHVDDRAPSPIPRFFNNQSYAAAIAAAGGIPVMIPSLSDPIALAALYDRLDGLLLTGGPDIAPERYGAERHVATDAGDARMEATEFALIPRALRDGKPLLGICRGLQVMNVAAGGTLYQDLRDQVASPIDHTMSADDRAVVAHDVAVRDDTLLAALMGPGDQGVNSMHHQAARDVAPDWTVSASAPDGLVEAIELPRHPFALAVQWHPEELYAAYPAHRRLFEAFVQAAVAASETVDRGDAPPTHAAGAGR